MAFSGSRPVEQPMVWSRKEGNFKKRFLLLAPGAASAFTAHLPASELLAGKSSQPGLNGILLTADHSVKNRPVCCFTVKHRKTRFLTQYTHFY